MMIAESLGPYRILGRLGEGGTGEVYRARDTKLVEGDDLSALIARGALPLAEALSIARQIAEALEGAIDGGSEPIWRRDGREIYYLKNVSQGGTLKVRVMAVPVTTTPALSVGAPRMLFEGPFRMDGGSFRNYDVTPDGQRFVMVREVDQPPARVSQMVLVQNWIEELKTRVPAGKR